MDWIKLHTIIFFLELVLDIEIVLELELEGIATAYATALPLHKG
jgi:hypothetical protein